MPTRPGSPLSQPWAPSSAVMPYRSSWARTGCEVLVSSAAVSCVDSVVGAGAARVAPAVPIRAMATRRCRPTTRLATIGAC